MKLSRFDGWFLTFIFFFNVAIKLFRLNSPAYTFFDERAHFVPAARDYLVGIFETEPTHPLLGKLFMAAGIQIFGDNPWGWRVPEVLVGSLGVIFIYLLAKEMFPPSQKASEDKLALTSLITITKDRLVPVLASVFLTFEFSWFIHSRVGLIEIYVATFSLAAAYFFWRFHTESDSGSKTRIGTNLLLAGVFFGLAIGSKWSGLFLLVFAVAFYLWFNRMSLVPALQKMTLLVLTTLVVYIGSFSPFLVRNSIPDLVRHHTRMLGYHLVEYSEKLEQTVGEEIGLLNYQYAPWTWVFNGVYPLLTEKEEGNGRVVAFMFNPALFWGALLAMVLSLKKLLKDQKKVFLVGGFFAFWIPWVFFARIAYPYYLLPAIPFGILFLSSFLGKNYKEKKFLIAGFSIVVVALFFFYYPLLSAIPVPPWYLKLLTGGSL